MRRQFYVSGVYTAPNDAARLRNIRNAMNAGLSIMDLKGWFPIVPHCSMNHETNWSTAMAVCCATVSSLDPQVDCVVMLPGWENSKGAREERDLALAFGIEVLTLVEVLS